MPLNIDFQQIFLHLFNFGILFGGLYFLLYSPVKKFMEKRRQTFQDQADAAAANLKDSEEKKALYEKKLADYDEEVRSKRESARSEINEMRDKKLAEAAEEASRIISKAKDDGQREKERIISSAQKDISELVKEAAEKLALGASASDEYDVFLDAAEERSDS